MITQAKIKLYKTPEVGLNTALGAKIHGWLLNTVSSAIGEKLHAFGEVRPYSLYVKSSNTDCDWLVLNILHESALELLEVMANAQYLTLSGIKDPIIVCGIQSVIEKSTKDILDDKFKVEFRLEFLTPATYKLNNQYSNWFDLSRLIMGSIKKLNAFENTMINARDFHGINESIDILNYQLKSAKYLINSNPIRSFVGDMKCQVKGKTETEFQLRQILNYCQYSGIGAKTAMGMGGFHLETIR